MKGGGDLSGSCICVNRTAALQILSKTALHRGGRLSAWQSRGGRVGEDTYRSLDLSIYPPLRLSTAFRPAQVLRDCEPGEKDRPPSNVKCDPAMYAGLVKVSIIATQTPQHHQMMMTMMATMRRRRRGRRRMIPT